MKRFLSIFLSILMLAIPFLGVFPASMVVNAAVSTSAPLITANIAHLQTVSPQDTIIVTVTPQGGNTLASSSTDLEGMALGTGGYVAFTPAGCGLQDGVYTIITTSKDSAGNTAIQPLTFYVKSDLDAAYTVSGNTVTSDGTVTMHQATALPFVGSYGTSADGSVDLSALTAHDALSQYYLQYTDKAVEVSSVSGIPYEVFNIDLQGKTSGEIAVAYSGTTKKGERMALKAFNVATKNWDVLDTFIGSGNISASLNVATYSDNGTVHVAAVLDYVSNGSNTMIWSTDPQHYTKFEDLHEFYYEVYRYAAKEYQNGNAGYIITTGDLVDDRPTAAVASKQWSVSDKAMSYVEAVGMPNGLVSGNHDVCDYKLPDYSTGENTNDYSKFWQTFPATRYNNERWFGGSINNNMSHYDLITIGNIDFIVMYLGYGREATDETIAWANQALKTYSHRTAIIATHEYLDATTAQRAGRGELIYKTIVDPNPNVKMVICGHDDGALCNQTIAGDGRVVYEILSDYQFVEAEDPDFYANEHWIGSVPSCCGDGYIRLMSVEGDTLSSITYSPVTGRYNPHGDRESFSIDLNCGAPDRAFTTTRFSAAVVSATTTSTAVDRIGVITKNGNTSYTTVLYATTPAAPSTGASSIVYGDPATKAGSSAAHAASSVPETAQKVDVLSAVGLSNDTVVNGAATYGNYALGLNVDLNKTPYLYYSFAVPSNSHFTFAFINNTSNAPWLTFMDNRLGGGTMNYGADKWDAAASQQFFTTSMTGCVDMRTMMSVAGATDLIINQFNVYHYMGDGVTLNYLFFGSAPTSFSWPDTTYGEPATTDVPVRNNASKNPPVTDSKVDILTAAGLSANTFISSTGISSYTNLGVKADLGKTPYLYYSLSIPANADLTFAFINDTTTAPWLTFLDAKKGGSVLNYGNATWDAAAGTQYFHSSVTGCIDLRQFTNTDTATSWKINELRFYHYNGDPVVVNYLFFGSDSTSGYQGTDAPNDLKALQNLIAKANAMSTSGYTSASVSEFNAAKQYAAGIDTASEATVKAAYIRLENAIGGLQKSVNKIAASSLKSIKNYPMTTANWKCGVTGAASTASTAWLLASDTSGGMKLQRTSNATHMWPSVYYVGSGTGYTVNPNGKLYMNVEVVAANNWMIEMTVTQAGKTLVFRPNAGIDNALAHGIEAHSAKGTYSGVYDISEVFAAHGLDPAATFSVSKTVIYVTGSDLRCTATVKHLELMTDPDPASVNRTPIYDAVSDATHRTQSLYTAASWSAMQTALSAAYTAANDSSISSAALNLAAYNLRNATAALVLKTTYEPEGSLLPDDVAQLIPSNDAHISVWRDSNNAIVLQNSNNEWPCATYIFSPKHYVRVADSQLNVDISVSEKTNVRVLIDGEWISLSAYIGVADSAGDLGAGDYRVQIPLSAIAACKNKVTVTISDVQIYSIGKSASSAVTVRRIALEAFDDYRWDSSVTYGPAATAPGVAFNHPAKNGPTVSNKVDLLAAAGLESHPDLNGLESFGDDMMHLDIDLNKTPYLYYSFIVRPSGRFTFSFFNKNTNVPWMVYLDATKGGAQMDQGSSNWDADSANSNAQFTTVSQTGCIDMRQFLTDTSDSIWRINRISFYAYGATATMSYLYFGSAPLDNGYVEDTYTVGDVNDDGSVSTVDARMILGYVLGVENDFTDVQKKAADYDRNGSLSTTDIRAMLQAIINA